MAVARQLRTATAAAPVQVQAQTVRPLVRQVAGRRVRDLRAATLLASVRVAVVVVQLALEVTPRVQAVGQSMVRLALDLQVLSQVLLSPMRRAEQVLTVEVVVPLLQTLAQAAMEVLPQAQPQRVLSFFPTRRVRL